MFQILETILSPIITFIPSHQTFESKVGILGLSLHIVAGSFQGEEYFIAGQNHLIRWPVCLATELGQDQIVLLLLDDVRVLTRHQRTLDVPRPLVRRVHVVQLEAVLLLAGAAPGVELHGHPADAGGEHHLVVPDSFVRKRENLILSWTETYGLHCSILRLREANLEPKTEP